MKRIFACFAVLAAVGLTSSVASAAPACMAPANVQTTAYATATGCDVAVAGLNFSNFAISSIPTASMQVFVQSIVAGSTGVDLNFQIAGFIVTAGSADLQIVYEVRGANITSVDNTFGGGTGSGIVETVCDSAGVSGGVCARGGKVLGTLSNTITGGNVSVSFAPQTDIWIIKDITAALLPGMNSITVSGFTNSHETSGVPEPMTLSMMGAGLLGLSLISRRRKKS